MIQHCPMVYVLVFMITVAGNDLAAGSYPKFSQDQQKPTSEDAVRLSASLVQVPAVVTDRSGKFVSDLSRSDFTVSEDGKRQDIAADALHNAFPRVRRGGPTHPNIRVSAVRRRRRALGI